MSNFAVEGLLSKEGDTISTEEQRTDYFSIWIVQGIIRDPRQANQDDRLSKGKIISQAVAVMQFELVNPEEAGRLFRLDKGFPIHCVKLLEALFIDLLDDVLTQPRDFGDLLEGVCSLGEQVPCIVVKGECDAMPLRLEQHFLHLGYMAMRTIELLPVETEAGQGRAYGQMPQVNAAMVVHVHPPAAGRADRIGFLDFDVPIKAVRITMRTRGTGKGLRVGEAR